MYLGIGQAAASGPSVVVLNTYFEKKRGLANSLSNSGGSLGGLLLPLIIQSLLETYGLFGAQIVVSGMLLNIVVSGALLKARTGRSAEKRLNIDIEVESECMKEKSVNNNQNSVSVSLDDVSELQRYDQNTKLADKASMRLIIPKSLNTRPRTFSENLHEHRCLEFPPKTEAPLSAGATNDSKFKTVSALFGSLADVSSSIQSVFLARKINSVTEGRGNGIVKSEKSSGLSSQCLSLINFRILKNHYLKCIYVVGFLAVFGTRLQLAYIPPYARDYSISGRNISYLVTIIGSCDFIGRFAVSWIADNKRLKRNHIIATSLIIVGVASLLTSWLTSFPLFVVYSVLYGLFGGLYNSVLPLLLVDAVGANNLSTALAFAIQVHGISISGFAPILGKLCNCRCIASQMGGVGYLNTYLYRSL